ncbi:glucose-6-phosphate dehydrogenase [Chloracidobacterium sp. D]|jgi:glucose-6-phosphate 1-dehydrogenase|uniref:glucose-6-phosphate dehydrogenase n=1 Tax=Chloracidobacterium sp. D TaxID=2821536 RepID=UPI001B8A956F|nr:glucose-6-phosphate dehydrogenase [Chloracidobacterium sp. D]QUV80861.1 glucose-6-phosphate dehydrogenase [Chloracidobacterium sp. D]
MANDLNPLRAEARVERTPDPCTVVIFGASGDLAKRKLVPALFNLARERRLPGGFSIVGYSRSPLSDEALRALMYEAVVQFSSSGPPTAAEWESFAAGMFYCQGGYDDVAGYTRLKERLAAIDAERGTSGNRIFYLSTPPSLIGPIMDTLGASELARSAPGSWTRIIIEKPLGYDLKTAQELNAHISRIFDESQVYRIDHYRAKETVQNIVAMRFANGIFEPVWNRRYIDHVQITAAEAVGVEGRGGYYEGSGAVRDMLQNHLLQLLALVAMEPPISLEADAIRDEAIKVAKAIRPLVPSEVDAHAVRGQYTAGWVGGKAVPGYREEEGVSPTSTTETYAAIRFEIDNWRWAGVPFFLRSGKRMTKRAAEIAVQFRQVPMRLFSTTEADLHEPNLLVMKIQPDEGLTLRLAAKLPGHAIHLRSVNMEFRYGTSFGVRSSEAYERLLLDCMFGDATLFTRRDMVETGWALMMPILDHWAASGERNLHFYEAGTWGPEAANRLMDEGRAWRRL